ncbi:hypothetical protein RN001_003224 [Aquatica leii]|uniref:Uncharacterized protein n=1 Tax=Aquatica leii TaxID=1421715 RepID=A0AAN7QNZ0_9COLE|nr:hypothetical protein RN001_003224 [Aquatica leii]
MHVDTGTASQHPQENLNNLKILANYMDNKSKRIQIDTCDIYTLNRDTLPKERYILHIYKHTYFKTYNLKYKNNKSNKVTHNVDLKFQFYGLNKEKTSTITEWLALIPRVSSHYYWCKKNNIKYIPSRITFCKVLDKKNISIHKPQKDLCNTCYKYNAGNLNQEDYNVYRIKNKKLVTQSKKRKTKPLITSSGDYINRMRVAKPKHPYQVFQIVHTFFKNYEDQKCNLASIRPGRRAGDPTVCGLRALQHPENWKNLPQRRLKKPRELLAPLYNEAKKVKPDKIRHLQQLKSFLPIEYNPFYDSLQSE